MEDLTDQVEIVFHSGSIPIPIDPSDSSIIQLEPLDEIQASTSSRMLCDLSFEHVFKIPEVPVVVRKVVQDQRETKPFIPYKFVSPTPNVKVQQEEEEEEEEDDDSHSDEDDDDEWEETLIYVDLDDIPSVEELFAVEPDDFLLSQSKKEREETKPAKSMYSSRKLKFYNLDDKHPILQIGNRFYMGKYEEPFGTDLFFREKSKQPEPRTKSSSTNPNEPRKTVLRSLIPETQPPSHPVFGINRHSAIEYELVANVHKVLKMTRRNVLRIESNDDTEKSDSGVPSTSSAVDVNSFELRAIPIPDDLADSQTRDFVPLRTVNLKQGIVTNSVMKQRNQAYLKRMGLVEEEVDEDEEDIEVITGST